MHNLVSTDLFTSIAAVAIELPPLSRLAQISQSSKIAFSRLVAHFRPEYYTHISTSKSRCLTAWTDTPLASSGNGSLKVPNTQTTTWTVDVPSYGPLVATTLIYSQTTTYSGAIPPFDAALTGSLSSLCNAQYQSTDTSQYAAMHANAVEYTTTNAANPQGTLVETSITETILGDRPYFATSPPCVCHTTDVVNKRTADIQQCGTCNITASTVQVLFWPTSASASLANVTTVVSNGFTLFVESTKSSNIYKLTDHVVPLLVFTLAFQVYLQTIYAGN